MSDGLAIDRLVLDMPGLDAARGARLAERIGAALAGRLTASGDLADVAVQIDAIDGETDERLAARIAAALLRQIG
jgi:hypothetical protein